MSARLAVSPLLWTNDDLPALGGATPIEQCLAEARQAGFAGVELGSKFPRQASSLASLLAEHSLVLASGWYGARLLSRSVKEERAAMLEHVRLLEAMGCRVMVFAEVTGSVHAQREVALSRRPRLDPGDFARLAAALCEVALFLEDHGMRLAYHQHVGTVVETAGDLRRLCDQCTARVGLTFDTGHLFCAGLQPGALADEFGERIVHVHLKDVRPAVLADTRARDLSFLDAVLAGLFTVPGDGGVDFAPVLRRLAAQEYPGWLVVEAEQDPARALPLTYARLGHRQSMALAVAAGLAVE